MRTASLFPAYPTDPCVTVIRARRDVSLSGHIRGAACRAVDIHWRLASWQAGGGRQLPILNFSMAENLLLVGKRS